MPENQAVCAGKHGVVVELAYTSQDCSAGGERVRKRLSVRTPICPSCGLVVDRDEYAARNMFRAVSGCWLVQQFCHRVACDTKVLCRFPLPVSLHQDKHADLISQGHVVHLSTSARLKLPSSVAKD